MNLFHCEAISEVCLGPCKTSMIEFFTKINPSQMFERVLKAITIWTNGLTKKFIEKQFAPQI